MIPKGFYGRFLIHPNGIEDPITITFYRRETETKSLQQFIDSIRPEDIGWDCVTAQLYYKSKDNKAYKLNFEEL
jgi:hypothetical protein